MAEYHHHGRDRSAIREALPGRIGVLAATVTLGMTASLITGSLPYRLSSNTLYRAVAAVL
jgi:hypothetical protein